MTHFSRIILFSLLIHPSLSFGQKASGFEINGEIANADGKKIFLAPTAQAMAMDSAIIRDGVFRLHGRVKETDYYALQVEGQTAYAWFILSNEKLKFTGDADSMRQSIIIGSK